MDDDPSLISVIIGGAGVGAALAAASFVSFGTALAPFDAIDRVETTLKASRQTPVLAVTTSAAVVIAAHPLFPSTAPSLVAEPEIRVTGIVKSPRKAALIMIGGGAAQWQALGATRDAVTLREIRSSDVTVETASGTKTVPLYSDASSKPVLIAPAS